MTVSFIYSLCKGAHCAPAVFQISARHRYSAEAEASIAPSPTKRTKRPTPLPAGRACAHIICSLCRADTTCAGFILMFFLPFVKKKTSDIFSPPAGMRGAYAVPLAVTADAGPQAGSQDFFLHLSGKVAEGKDLLFLQAAESQHCPVIVCHQLRLITEPACIVWTWPAHHVSTYRQPNRTVSGQLPQQLCHMGGKPITITIPHKIGHTHPMVGPERKRIT